ncbi:MAG: class I SAM-dependent methyltransferase [Chloroflexota bacterium]|nr:class I SAM-dependent methyltransferase [Chloroflexota bacterium]MDE2909131.1 class I SAM-dependent methyltransferase [Chloroflexota bacterium]
MTARQDFFQDIYHNQAEQYDRLVAREDMRGNLFAALSEIRPLHGLNVVEFGAGTGRVTRQLSVIVDSIFAFDIEPSMLRKADNVMRETGMTNWRLSLGDNIRMPVASDCADLVIEGWSFAHVIGWHPDDWRARTAAMLSEMERILKPGGSAILIETMGTGRRQPQAPSAKLAQLYEYWQRECGFAYRWIRTDYQFASPEEADELMRFFFGDAMADGCLDCDTVIVPECTGVWWKRVAG